MEDKKIKVMVTDDEADFRQLMRFWLESKGYYVIEASSGEEAIAKVKKEKPDIVFMDIRMPELSGIEAIKKIRRFNKSIPVIVISAYVNDPEAAKAKDLNISGIFNKGADFNEGLALLETALRTHKELRK